MSNGIRSLPRYQMGGAYRKPKPQVNVEAALAAVEREERKEAFRRGISSLFRNIADNPVSSLRRLASLVLGKRGVDQEISRSIFRAVTPDYDIADEDQLFDALGRIARGDPGALEREMRPDPEEDAWRTYLELPQEHGTFGEAEYRPTIGSGEDIRYRDFADPNRVIDILASRSPNTIASSWLETSEEKRRQETIEGLVKAISSGERGISRLHPWGHREVEGGPYHAIDASSYGDVMGTYTLGTGEDEEGPYVSYYDKWDLAPQVAKYSRAGKPFDIYGRMYYDPDTYEYLDPTSP